MPPAGAGWRSRSSRRAARSRCRRSLLAFAAVQWGAPDDAHPLADSLAIAALACALGWPATWYLQATQQLNRWARVEVVVYAAMIVGCFAFARSVHRLRRCCSSPLRRCSRCSAGAGCATICAAAAPGLALYSRAELRPGLRLGWKMLPVSVAGAAYSLALPAAASAQLSRPELGVYFMADRLVRAVLARGRSGVLGRLPAHRRAVRAQRRAALWYAARWAAAGSVAGALRSSPRCSWLWPWIEPAIVARAGDIDVQAVHAVAFVLAWLWPLLFAWKFIGYWMLGSGRHDSAYRTCVVVGGIVGVAAAATVGGRAGALGLAWTALGVELLVIAVAIALMAAGRVRANLRASPR